MCGIFGFVGDPADVGASILTALRTLEYRGYDSWGVAVGTDDGIAVEKRTGKIGSASVTLPESTIGFGHTRWATHGGVTWANAHPHLDQTGRIAVIHNGIVDNFRALRDDLAASGSSFASETDSEVIAHLVGRRVEDGSDLVHAVSDVLGQLDGFNAVIAMRPETGELVAAKNVSPLVIGWGTRGVSIASDTLALGPHATRVLVLEDHMIVRLFNGGIDVYDEAGNRQPTPAFTPIDPVLGDSGLCGYSTFMAKEMAEQPAVIDRVAANAQASIDELASEIRAASETFLIGCGTASYAAQTGAYLLGQIAGQRVSALPASEISYLQHLMRPGSLVIALSQSGETADVIDAMMTARKSGARLAAIVNVRQSTLDRMVDARVYLDAGPEQCVLSTKAYTAKVSVLLQLAMTLAGTAESGQVLLHAAADAIRTMLNDATTMSTIVEVASRIHRSPHVFVVGRGVNYPSALESALKVKEVSYIHAEGFAGGELKHGVIALIEPGTPCLVIAPDDATRTDTLSGAMELRSRGGHIIGIGTTPDPVFDDFIAVPDVGAAQPIVNVVPAQMLGYHCAMMLGLDPDKPRNLAKSVTVK